MPPIVLEGVERCEKCYTPLKLNSRGRCRGCKHKETHDSNCTCGGCTSERRRRAAFMSGTISSQHGGRYLAG